MCLRAQIRLIGRRAGHGRSHHRHPVEIPLELPPGTQPKVTLQLHCGGRRLPVEGRWPPQLADAMQASASAGTGRPPRSTAKQFHHAVAANLVDQAHMTLGWTRRHKKGVTSEIPPPANALFLASILNNQMRDMGFQVLDLDGTRPRRHGAAKRKSLRYSWDSSPDFRCLYVFVDCLSPPTCFVLKFTSNNTNPKQGACRMYAGVVINVRPRVRYCRRKRPYIKDASMPGLRRERDKNSM